MLDVEGSLQLCMAFGDDDSYRLNYLVEKLGISDPKTVQKALSSPKKFHDVVSKNTQAGIGTTVYDAYAKQLLYRD